MIPELLMAPPSTWHTTTPNNVWMTEDLEPANHPRAWQQWHTLYSTLASEVMVSLLPLPAGHPDLQDVVFVANLGIALPGNTVILSNFTAPARHNETAVGQAYFPARGANVHVAPHKFEGEADFKHLHDNVYIGGYGQRTQLETYEWMTEQFGLTIIPVFMRDEHLYHLDCSVLPLTPTDVAIVVDLFEPAELKAIEEHATIWDVSRDSALAGICNSLVIDNDAYNCSNISTFSTANKHSLGYFEERAKNQELEDLAADTGLDLTFVNVDEFVKSGALLSCLVMDLTALSIPLPTVEPSEVVATI